MAQETKKVAQESAEDLHRGLSTRQLTMISIGGVIGVGMFLGSGSTVKLAGPGVVVSYLLGGIIMFLTMLALGEMSVRKPVAGSFRVYAHDALGPYAGYLVGVTYALCWMTVMSAEIVAASTYMGYWFPGNMTWIFGIIFALIMAVVNMIDVKYYGEFEFWFASIKVVAIVVFLVLGVGLIMGIGTGHPIGTANYLGHGGFFPKGISGVLLAMIMTIFAYGGTEVVGVAAGETANPEKAIPIAINGILVRTLVLYLGSMLVLVGVIPWMEVGLKGSPFVLVFKATGIPYAADIMNFVVITAALSGMNCGLYTNSRMIYSLSKGGYVPAFLGQVNKNKVPVAAVWASTLLVFLGLALYYTSPDKAFLWITSVGSFGFQFTWFMILLSQIYLRKKNPEEALKFPMPGAPYTSWFALICLVGVFIIQFFLADLRIGAVAGIIWLAILTIYYMVAVKNRFNPESLNEAQH